MTFPVIPRRSSTLILALRSHLSPHTAPTIGYKLLMLQRSSASKFMPNTYVFPGGAVETTDFSSEWLELIGQKGLPLKTLMTNSTFYSSYTGLPANSLPPYVGFRICAIRETFEESGVLLVKSLTGDQNKLQSMNINSNKLNKWRKMVHNDASLFLQFCRDIQCVPDIWSLYEWSNWITPTNNLRRYNTMFYLAFLDDEPDICHDGQEMTNSSWIRPDATLLPLLRKEYNIPPPQFVEMSRLCWFTNVNELKKFAQDLKGVEEWEPVPAMCKNEENLIYFLPGDVLYEQLKQDIYKHYQKFVATNKLEDLRRIPMMKLSQTMEELQDKSKNMNRIITNPATGQFTVECNTTSKYNMPPPMDIFKRGYSKL